MYIFVEKLDDMFVNKNILNFLYILFVPFFISAQKVSLNTELVSQVAFNENSSDIWGFENNGIKYAIIGNATKTSVFSLEDPYNPILRYVVPGASSIWRDIKSYNNHLYVTADQGQDGVVIIDMNGAPLNITHTNFRPELKVTLDTKELQRCHNLYIDEKGFMYLAGCNISQRGVLIFDLKIDPKSPKYIGAADLTYSHDAFARGDTLYASEINIGKLSIYDISDRSMPKLLASQATSRTFTHNAWPSEDSKYVFTTDEKSGGYVDAYDITDLNNIKLIDKFRPVENEKDGVIPHNTHYSKGYLITSWYTDGLRIVDAHKPDNLVEVAYYDTWQDPTICHNSYHGCWGAFPFTGSDLIYGSDIENGLYIVKVNYKRACYLEGKITDSDGIGISNAVVEILSTQPNREVSAPSGIYKTGIADSGDYLVRISHPNYTTQTLSVNINNGDITALNVKLIKKRPYDLDIEIKDAAGMFISADVYLTEMTNEYNFNSKTTGASTASVLSAVYDVFVSSWGFKGKFYKDFAITDGASNEIKAVLDSGYEDNFENDLGWTVVTTSGSPGAWVRAIPRATEYINNQTANPGLDSDDTGQRAYVTGNGLKGAGCDDVDNGNTELVSPVIDLSKHIKPKLNYDVWFFNSGGSSPKNDTLVVKLSNGLKEVVIDKIYGITNGWFKMRDLDVTSFIQPTKEMNLIVEASDQAGNQGHIVEAGFDNFFITDVASSTDDNKVIEKAIQLSPNPVNEKMLIRLEDPDGNSMNKKYFVLNITGQTVLSGSLDFHTSLLDVAELKAGIYFVKIDGYKSQKLIKL